MSANTKGRLEASLCESCYEVFFSKKLFESHIQQCNEPRCQSTTNTSQMGSSTLSKCATCRRIFLGGQNLAKHVKKMHGTKKVVKTVISCYDCKKLFMDLETLNKHKEQEHCGSTSSAAVGQTSAQPEGLQVDRKLQPKVVTISQPKVLSRGETVQEPRMMANMESMPKSESKSKPECESVEEQEPHPESVGRESELRSEPEAGSESDPRLEPEPCVEPEPRLEAEPCLGQEPRSGPAAEVVSMPVLEVDSDGSPLLDGLMVDRDPDTAGAGPKAINIPSASPPLALEDDSSPPAEPMDAAPETAEEPPLADQASDSAGSVSASQSAAATPTLTETPASAAAAGTSRSNGPGLYFACGTCNLMFVDKDMMMKHLAEKHGREVSSAAKRAPSAASAKKPAGRGNTLYACAVCDAKYHSVELVRAHIEAVHRAPVAQYVTKSKKVASRRDNVWSTQECVVCSSLFRPSARLRDIYMSLSEWTSHFYGRHGNSEKLSSGKRLELRPCHRCGLVFVNNATRLHHNAIAHGGEDPEADMKQKQQEEDRELLGPVTAQITPKSLTAKARSRVIVDSLMKASLVSRSTPTITMDKAAARRAQSKVFAARAGPGQRVTNVVFKCSKCGGMFPDDPSFERHAREAHRAESGRGDRAASPPSSGPPDPPPTGDVGQWDVLLQRECSDCSKLMESCPRSFALFVRRDVWERHVNEVHLTGRWRCTGERLRLHPCPHCPRLFLHPGTLDAHQAKLHDTMLGPVDQADVDACTPTNTLECSRCSQLVQNADGIRFLDHAVWKKHFETEHKELLLCDGKAGDWQLFPCAKCQRLFFNSRDILTHEARQAYMHMPMPVNAKVTTQKRGHRAAQETEIMYQCANDNCSFTSQEHDAMVSHFQQCQQARPTRIGETVLYKTVMVRKPPPKPRRLRAPFREPPMRRLENVMQKLASSSTAEGEPSETAAAVNQLLQTASDQPPEPAVLELDPVTCKPRSAHTLEAAEDVPEAAAEEETVAAEEPQPESSATAPTAGRPTRMDFACSICKMRGSTREEIAAHIRRDHKRSDGTFGPPTSDELNGEQLQRVRNYKSAYLCAECKRMAEPCQRTRDLYFEKAAWLNHLSTSHNPVNFSELDRLDLHECDRCERLYLSHASLKRHWRFYHEPGSENYRAVQPNEERNEKYKFSCVEEGCTFKYHRITRLRSHLINVHNFDLAVREVEFNNENDFQEWKKTLELNTNAYFVLRSNIQAKRKNGTFNVRYFGCSRVMAHMPSYKQNGKKRSLPWQVDLLKEDMVWRCPAFMKAEVADNSTSINVSFCPNHYGHDMDPSFGRLSDADEAEIGGMLRAGLSIQDVLKRMREEGHRQGTPNRKQRVTEAEINRIFEKYMGMKPPKAKRFDPLVGKAVSRTSRVSASSAVRWNADLVSYDDGGMEGQETVGDDLSLDDGEAVDDSGGARDAWQRVCGEDECRFTTTSVGFLRSHLRQRHGFAMHIDTAGFASMKDFTRWKRNLEKRTCAKYTCYKSVAPSDPTDPVVTRYYTCHRSGLNSLKRAPGHAPPPRRLVLCTGYMKVRCDSSSGEVACEYCASHYGHDARLADRRLVEHGPGQDLMPVEYETVEDDGETSPPMVGHFGSPERRQFSSPATRRYSYIREEGTASDQETEQERPRRPRGRPPKKRAAAPRRSRGGKRRRWEEIEEIEEEEEEEEEEQQQEDSFESD